MHYPNGIIHEVQSAQVCQICTIRKVSKNCLMICILVSTHDSTRRYSIKIPHTDLIIRVDWNTQIDRQVDHTTGYAKHTKKDL